jgi:hypothetical protein
MQQSPLQEIGDNLDFKGSLFAVALITAAGKEVG